MRAVVFLMLKKCQTPDYLEIVALQHGFDSYEELRYNGIAVDIEEKKQK